MRRVGAMSAVNDDKRPAPLRVSKSVALVGSALKSAGEECHPKHG